MVILRFTLQSFHLNITLNQFHIQTPLRSNRSMMMKWNISWNSSTENMMTNFWILTSRCFRLDWWSPLLQTFIQSLMCSFIKTEDRMLQSQIACHNFLYFSQPRPLWNWLIETQDMPKKLGFFYIALLNIPLFIQ